MRDHSTLRLAAIGVELTVLSQDILAVDPDAIVRTKAMMTVVGGKIVHRSEL